ncbi:MAG: aminotransferase class V-fold PLP-dependent enzyme, partial [Aestuariivirgaceae bacterium]
FYLVDGTQAVAHLPVDVKAAKADFYVFSGHKMYGPDGIGVLYVDHGIRHLLAPVRSGGGTVKDVAITFGKDFDIVSPDYDGSLSILSGGTPNTSNIIGLAKAVRLLQSIGWKHIREHEEALTRRLLDGLAQFPEVEIYGPRDVRCKIGVVSFSLDGFDIRDAAEHLAAQNICIRYGAHCALPLSDALGRETLRVSLGIYNSEADIDHFLGELRIFLKHAKKPRNPRCLFLRNVPFARRIHRVASEDDIFDLIESLAGENGETEFAVLGGHFLGIPSLRDNRFYPSIEGILPAHLERFADEFGMTSFPLYTFDLAAEAVCRLQRKGINARLLIIANDTTGINELRLSAANRALKTAEAYRAELFAAFEQQDGLPEAFLAGLERRGLSPADIIRYGDKFYFRESILRARFKRFVSRNKDDFAGVI